MCAAFAHACRKKKDKKHKKDKKDMDKVAREVAETMAGETGAGDEYEDKRTEAQKKFAEAQRKRVCANTVGPVAWLRDSRADRTPSVQGAGSITRHCRVYSWCSLLRCNCQHTLVPCPPCPYALSQEEDRIMKKATKSHKDKVEVCSKNQ